MNIETSVANVFLKQNDIVVIKYKPNAEVGLEEMIAIHEAEKKVTNEKKHTTLLDARGFITISNEAREFGASAVPMKYRTAAALLVNKTAVRILGNFYLTFNRPKVLTKMFSDEKKAMDWLTRQ